MLLSTLCKLGSTNAVQALAAVQAESEGRRAAAASAAATAASATAAPSLLSPSPAVSECCTGKGRCLASLLG